MQTASLDDAFPPEYNRPPKILIALIWPHG